MLAICTPMRVCTTVQRWPSVWTLVAAPRPMASRSPATDISSASGPISGSRHGSAVLPLPATTDAASLTSASALRSADSTEVAPAGLPTNSRQ